jgi:hypothetical protein
MRANTPAAPKENVAEYKRRDKERKIRGDALQFPAAGKDQRGLREVTRS